MIVPASVAVALERQQAVLTHVREYAADRLRSLCHERQWLYDERWKSPESALAKLEAGRTATLADMDDLWAALVVVPTRAEVPEAAAALLELFDAEQKPRRSTDPRAFPYDDVHVIACLGGKVAPAVISSPEVRNRRFEVQVHTGLQYAWWRATHDTLYKGGSRDWRAERAASQARASLELLDAVLADLHGAGRLQSEVVPEDDPDLLAPALWLELWRPADRPRDVLRFCDTTLALARACRIPLAELGERLHSDDLRGLLAERDLTPAQIVTIAVAQLVGADFGQSLRDSGVRVLVTREMTRHQASLATLDDELRCEP